MNARSSRFSLVALIGFGLALAGCGGGGSNGYGSYGGGPADVNVGGTYQAAPGYYQPAPPSPPVATFATLTVQVTNDSTATIDVTATTPDETVDAGDVAPGETIQFDMGELPPWATLSATAVTTDANGNVPSYPDDTVSDGIDYSDTDPFVGIDWQDSFASSLSTTGSAPASSAIVATKVPAKSNVKVVTPTRKPRS